MTESHVFIDTKYTVVLLGPNRNRNRELPTTYGGNKDKVCLVKFASNSSHIGFREVKKPKFGLLDSDEFDIYGDIVLLTEPGTSVVAQTADCLTTIMYEKTVGRLAVTHCGRPALTPHNTVNKEINNIVTIAYEALTFGIKKPDVESYITGGICGKCFVHDRPEAQELIKPFDQFGPHAFVDREKGALDLTAIVCQQLRSLGVKSNSIKTDNLCTAETPWLTSYRNDPKPRNAVIVVLH